MPQSQARMLNKRKVAVKLASPKPHEIQGLNETSGLAVAAPDWAMTIAQLRQHVARFSPDGPQTEALQHAVRARFKKRDVWYRTQKEHWTGWLSNYDGPGYYGRQRWDRDAQFVYNHIQCAPMLLWLAEAAGVPSAKVTAASAAVLAAGPRLSSQVRALRQILPWSLIEATLKAEPTAPTATAAPTREAGAGQKKMPRE